MPPTRRNAPFCSPSARETNITNISTPWATCDASTTEAPTIRTTSIPMTVGRNGAEGQALEARAISTLRGTAIKKVTMAERCPKVARQSCAVTAIAPNTKLPVTCPVNVLASTKPAASPYPPTKASPKESQVSVKRMFVGTISPWRLLSFSRHRSLRSEMKFRLLQSDSIRYVNGTASSSIYLLIQSIAGTVIARASVEIKSIDAVSDWAALYRAAKSTTTVARGKLQHTSDSRAKGLMTCKRCSSANSTADWTVIRASEPAKTPGERRTG